MTHNSYYDSSTIVDAESVRDRLTSCISEVAKWCALQPRHAEPNPSTLVAGQLQNQVQAALLHPRNSLRSQPDVPDANRPVSQRQ